VKSTRSLSPTALGQTIGKGRATWNAHRIYTITTYALISLKQSGHIGSEYELSTSQNSSPTQQVPDQHYSTPRIKLRSIEMSTVQATQYAVVPATPPSNHVRPISNSLTSLGAAPKPVALSHHHFVASGLLEAELEKKCPARVPPWGGR
jgi:hypothetical protein